MKPCGIPVLVSSKPDYEFSVCVLINFMHGDSDNVFLSNSNIYK